MALTAQNARDDLLLLKKDLSDVTQATFLSWVNAANRAVYRFICGVDPERFTSTQDYTVNSSPQTSALPTDFQDIQRYGMGFFFIDNAGNMTPYPLVQTGPGSQTPGYYFVNTNVIFTGIQTGTYRLRYMPKPTRITAMTGAGSYFTQDATQTGKVIIPDEYLEFLTLDLDVYYTRWDEQPGDETLADFRFSRVLAEMGTELKRTPDVYVMPTEGYGYNYGAPSNGGLWY